MNADSYYIGYKYKLKKCKLSDKSAIYTLILAVVALVCFILANQPFYGAFFFGFIVVMNIFNAMIKKNAVKKQVLSSPVLSGMHTLSVNDSGIEIFNSYEKIYAPWKSIFSIKNQKDRLIILPTFRKGIIVIDKNEENRQELDQIITALKNHTEVTEG